MSDWARRMKNGLRSLSSCLKGGSTSSKSAHASSSGSAVAILGVGTAVAKEKIAPEDMLKIYDMLRDTGVVSPSLHDWVSRRINNAGIETRHSVLEAKNTLEGLAARISSTSIQSADLVAELPENLQNIFTRANDFFNPTAAERAAVWNEFVPDLAVQAAQCALQEWNGNPSNVTHVLFHSCTGWKLPGVDVDIIDRCGLTSVRHNLCLNYNGCHAGDVVLELGRTFVAADPDAIVLVVCAECTTVHLTNADERSLVLGNTLFGDGAGAAVIGRSTSPTDWRFTSCARTELFHVKTRDELTFTPTDHAQRFFLSKEVPFLIGKFMKKNWKRLLRETVGTTNPNAVEWAIHPGGAAILQALEHPMVGIPFKSSDPEHPEQLEFSKRVLRDFGNMSSATIFFVLKAALKETNKNAMFVACFGPGICISTSGLTRGGATTNDD